MNDAQLLRYSRQIMLPDIDIEGQQRLLAAHAVVLGLGGLVSPAALYLAAAGVGSLTLIDDDVVELSNLQRQIAHGTGDIGRAKVESAKDSCLRLNPDVVVHTLKARLDAGALEQLLGGVDIVLDCSDNFSTRFMLNRVARCTRTPLVSGAAVRLEGQVAVFDHRDVSSPCYECLYDVTDDASLNCAENGVAAPLVGIIGTVQAMEALKLLAEFGTGLAGNLLVLDAGVMEWRKLKLPKNPECPVCRTH